METDYFEQIIYRNEQEIEDPYADPFDWPDENPDVMDYDKERNNESDQIPSDDPLPKHTILIADYVNKQ